VPWPRHVAGRVYAEQRPFVGPGYLFGDQDLLGAPGGKALYWLRVDPKRKNPLAELLPGPPESIENATTHRGLYRIANDGEVACFEFESSTFAKYAPAPPGFATRDATCVGSDYDGDRVLLVCGSPSEFGPFPKDAWLLCKSEWKKLTLTGTAPALSGAKLTYDAERTVWILAGGRDKTYKDGQKTFETDEKKVEGIFDEIP
jgi:hypothetical protein